MYVFSIMLIAKQEILV